MHSVVCKGYRAAKTTSPEAIPIVVLHGSFCSIEICELGEKHMSKETSSRASLTHKSWLNPSPFLPCRLLLLIDIRSRSLHLKLCHPYGVLLN